MDTFPITCPTCFEQFEIPIPPEQEMPTEYDYDCEVCCRPMLIILNSSDDIHAQGLAD